MQGPGSQLSGPRACLWDLTVGTIRGGLVPLQTFTLPVPRSREPPGEEEEGVLARALETLSNGRGASAGSTQPGLLSAERAKPHEWEERIC